MRKTLHTLSILLLLFGVGTSSYAQDSGQTPAPAAQPSKQPRVMILGNVYGGGELAQVIAESKEEAAKQLIQDADLATLFTTHADHVYTTYVHLGSESEVYGRVFGGGKGQHDGDILSSGRVTGQTDVALDGATVWSEIYGGGEMADVRGNTLLHFKKGYAGHNAFGGGLGVLGKRVDGKLVALDPTTDKLTDNRYEPLASADVMMIPADYTLITNDSKKTPTTPTLKSYYNNGKPITDQNYWMTEKRTGESFVVFDGTEDSYTHYEFKTARTVNRKDGKPVKNDSGKYYTETQQFDASRPEQLFSINHNIYGGGMTASKVDNKTFVHINYGMVNQEMMDYEHDGQKVWSTVYNSIANAQFCVFGGGYGYYTDILGDTNVTMDVEGSGYHKYLQEFREDIDGKIKSDLSPDEVTAIAETAPHSHGAPGRSCMDIVGGGYNGKVHGTTNVNVGGDVVLRKVYGGGYYASVGNTNVNIRSGIYNRIYGGGLIGNVYGTATTNIGQKQAGTDDEKHKQYVGNMTLIVKDAVYGGNDVSGTVGTSQAIEHTANGVTYNYYTPVDDPQGDENPENLRGYFGADHEYGVRLNIYGGLVLGDVYGAGNGNHPGYGNPEYMEFSLSQHPSENYRALAHAVTVNGVSKNHVYKYRPRTARVVMNIAGNEGSKGDQDAKTIDKVRIWGRTFGGGNSCNVGVWDGSDDDNQEKYSTDSDSWHPGDNFTGGGSIQINIGSHVQLGTRNDDHITPNGLFMGSNGEHMVTQHTDSKKAKYYHQYYDATTRKYWPGFPVYKEEDGHTTETISRVAGLKSFKAFINTITTKSDNVVLNIKNADDTEATDVWMSNFVGGGYRGSMQAATNNGKFNYTLPEGVTIGHAVVGGAFNAHVVYRIYATSGGHTYTTDASNNYKYLTDKSGLQIVDNEHPDGDYHHVEYAADGTTPTGIVRYNFNGGILAENSTGITGSASSRLHNVSAVSTDFITPSTGYNANKDKALVTLDLRNRLDPMILNEGQSNENVHGGIVYGGCFSSGFVEGDVWVDYRCTLSPEAKDVTVAGKGKYYDKTNPNTYAHADDLETHRALLVFGAGYGKDTTVDGDVYLRILHNGKSDNPLDYPLVYNAFGGGNKGKVAGNTNVYYNVGSRGTLLGSVYGGGYQGEIDGNTYLEMAGGLAINAYGGSREANIGGAAHVWVYDGKKFPTGEDPDEDKRDLAPLLIGNLYGGNDISGTISGGAKADYASKTWDAIKDTDFNTYIQVASTKADGSRGFPLIGNLYAGGNGANNNNPATAPNVERSLLHITGGNVLRAFGGGNRATITEDACILVNAPTDVFTTHEFATVQKNIIQQTVFKGIYTGYYWGGANGNTLHLDNYHAVNLFGGNNLAEMRIQPKWNLLDGSLGNVYSGGNMGDMTYYNATPASGESKGLSITVNSDKIHIHSLFGGCRMSDVKANATFGDDYYGATVNISAGHIENVYGGNDVSGTVYNGTKVNLNGAISGNVYGAGNGDYVYVYDTSASPVSVVTEKYDEEKQHSYYLVPPVTSAVSTDVEKIEHINSQRPSVTRSKLNIEGTAESHVCVKGNVYAGGNSAKVTGKDSDNSDVEFNIGSYVTLNGVYLGSNGENLVHTEFLDEFCEKNSFSTITSALLDKVMEAVDMDAMPKGFSDFGSKTLTDANIGVFCMGGNAGSMTTTKAVSIDFPAGLTIYDRIVGGCNNTDFTYKGVSHTGGFTGTLTEGTTTKMTLNVGCKFSPKQLTIATDPTTGEPTASLDYLVGTMDAKDVFAERRCNVYGGCFTSGKMVGGIDINIKTDMMADILNDDGTGKTLGSTDKNGLDLLNNTNFLKYTSTKYQSHIPYVFTVFGGGYGADTSVQGDIHVTMPYLTDGSGNVVYPRVNTLYGGSEQGLVVGNTTMEVRNGTVFNSIYGGSDAARLYGSTQTIVGYPTYYRCTEKGKYEFTRSDQSDDNLAKESVEHAGRKVIRDYAYYRVGDLISKNVYETLKTDADHGKFKEVTVSPQWTNTRINIGSGIYGGGFSTAYGAEQSAGTYTVCSFTNDYKLSSDEVDYGGNATIMVADAADAEHITISKQPTNITGKNVLGDGGIFGCGHLVFTKGFKAADISNYGYAAHTVEAPLTLNTFQRLDLLTVRDCCMQLWGARDFAVNKVDARAFSMARVVEMQMKSSVDADNTLPAYSNAKARNYVCMMNDVHYLGALVTNDKFEEATYHGKDGAVGSSTYQAMKLHNITTNRNISGKENDFKQRNLGTARNLIGINNGYCLKIQNACKSNSRASGEEIFYGPVLGVAEVRLLNYQTGEGGGYVYADNLHTYTGTDNDNEKFLQRKGNFVFPGTTDNNYIVDDCFPTFYHTGQSTTNEAPAHYWYVEGNKYYFNTVLTGYTYNQQEVFHLDNEDGIVQLSGLGNGKPVALESVWWKSASTNDVNGYSGDLRKHTGDKTYNFTIHVGPNNGSGTYPFSVAMPRTDQNITTTSEPWGEPTTPVVLSTANTYNSADLPIFDIELTDPIDNSGEEYFHNNLEKPEEVLIVMKGKDAQDKECTYYITAIVQYLQGPHIEGDLTVKNCALPGEKIWVTDEGISVTGDGDMIIRNLNWKLLPFHADTRQYSEPSAADCIDIDEYLDDTHRNLYIPALYSQNNYKVAFTFEAMGKTFSYTGSDNEGGKLLVHNYHRMKDVKTHSLEASLAPGARIYIEDEADLAAFLAALAGHDDVPAHDFSGQRVILTTDLTGVTANAFAGFKGTFDALGHSITLATTGTNDNAASIAALFGISTESDAVNPSVHNLLVLDGSTDESSDDYRYGKQAYDLNTYYLAKRRAVLNNNDTRTDAEKYVEDYYANGDYQYAGIQNKETNAYLRLGAPFYGEPKTNHDTDHTHDVRRWDEASGKNIPLYDVDYATTTFATPVAGDYNDYIYFGQNIVKRNDSNDGYSSDEVRPYPVAHNVNVSNVHNVSGDVSNRVFRAEGYYRSSTKQGFFHNADAVVLNPATTAVLFDHTETETMDQPKAGITTFSVDSNLDYCGSSYDNATTGHVTQNLLVYNAGEDIFTYRDTKDSQEAEVRYHNIQLRHVPDPSGVHNGDDALDYSPHRVPDASIYTGIPKRVNPADYVTDYFHLVDKQEFYAPIAFDVDVLAWYERLPQSYRSVSGSGASDYDKPSAWEGICLPFTVMTVNGEATGNIISHFYGDDLSVKGSDNGHDGTNYSPSRKADSSVYTSWAEWAKGNDHTLHHEYWLTGLVKADGENATFARPGLTEGGELFYDAKQYSADYDFKNTYYRTLPDYLSHYGTRNDDVYGDAQDQPWYSVPHTFKGYIHQTHDLPYLIAFPGNGYYEFDLSESGPIKHNQVITFSAPVTTIPASAPVPTTVGTHHHVGTFLHVAADGGHYVTNAAGSAFETDTPVLPFRTYMTTTSGSPRRIIIRDGGNETIEVETEEMPNIGDFSEPTLLIYGEGTTIIVESNYDTELPVYTPEGRRMRVLNVTSGVNRYENFLPNIYIVGGKKLRLQ